MGPFGEEDFSRSGERRDGSLRVRSSGYDDMEGRDEYEVHAAFDCAPSSRDLKPGTAARCQSCTAVPREYRAPIRLVLRAAIGIVHGSCVNTEERRKATGTDTPKHDSQRFPARRGDYGWHGWRNRAEGGAEAEAKAKAEVEISATRGAPSAELCRELKKPLY
ncbi:hypothetical protein DFH09DRAFT_1068561 [Mycena vulgaris]|nr:hypothetical protein DFH09DRAFT_1068561 [Mycena vulgaris]